MTHDDTQMMADGADGNPPATPWCYPHLEETRGYSKAVTFSVDVVGGVDEVGVVGVVAGRCTVLRHRSIGIQWSAVLER